MPAQPPKLLDQVRALLQTKHSSRRTETTSIHWVTHYIRFHGTRHPADRHAAYIADFLTYLAVERHVAESMQNQARNALVFLYREMLGIDVAGAIHAVRVKRPRRLPTVLTPAEVQAVLRALSGTHLLMAQLLYGSGIRLMECVRLRVKDLDVAQQQLIVREGKGQ